MRTRISPAGGSTISQQTAKNAFLWQGGGYFRKGASPEAREAMERRLADILKKNDLDSPMAPVFVQCFEVEPLKAYRKLGRAERAIEDVSAAIRIDPTQPEFFDNRGLDLAGNGDYARAIADYDEAIRLDLVEARQDLGDLDPGEVDLLGLRIAQPDRDRQAQRRDVRERMARVDRERGEDRVDLVDEALAEDGVVLRDRAVLDDFGDPGAPLPSGEGTEGIDVGDHGRRGRLPSLASLRTWWFSSWVQSCISSSERSRSLRRKWRMANSEEPKVVKYFRASMEASNACAP